jgi:hypothetical protein
LDDPALFNNGSNHTTLHHRTDNRADDGPLDHLTNGRAGFHKAAFHHRLDHLPDHRTALHDPALDYRLDNAPLHDLAFDDPALNAGLIVLIIDHHPLTSTRTVEPVVHDPALHTRAVEAIVVMIKGVAAAYLSLSRSAGDSSGSGECKGRQADESECFKREVSHRMSLSLASCQMNAASSFEFRNKRGYAVVICC